MSPVISSLFMLGLCSLLVQSSSASVPLLIWSQHIPSLETRFTTLVGQVDTEDVLEEYTSKVPNTPIIAFVQENLDVEQLTHSQLPFVSKLFDESSEFNTLFFTDTKHSPEFFGLFKKSFFQTNIHGKNIVYLKGKSLKENEKTIEDYNKLVNESQPVIFLFTGKDNRLMQAKERSRRAADVKDDSKVKIWETACSYYSASSVTVDETAYSISSVNATCENEDSKDKNIQYAKEIILISKDEIKITFKFTRQLHSWTTKSILITPLKGEQVSNISNPKFASEKGFSYSCSYKTFTYKKNDKDAHLIFKNFQIQPFIDSKSNTKYSDSVDCAVWFTIPIFSSLIVCLLLISILYFGVQALMSISTPDRFENPKGRTLIITNFEE